MSEIKPLSARLLVKRSPPSDTHTYKSVGDAVQYVKQILSLKLV